MKSLFAVTNTSVIDKLKFDERGLIPAIVQDVNSGVVLMLAYMDKQALEKTLTGGKACYFSRSRQELWLKGETSGHFQNVKEIHYDCDADSLLLKVEQVGVACHEDYYTCFHNAINQDGTVETKGAPGKIPHNNMGSILQELYTLALERKVTRPEGSYTTYLFDKGQDKILKKVGEETAEIIIASKNKQTDEIIYETGDLLYHLAVLLAFHEIDPGEISDELVRRRK